MPPGGAMRSGGRAVAALRRAGEGDPGIAAAQAAQLPLPFEHLAVQAEPALAVRAAEEPAALIDQVGIGDGEAAAGEAVVAVLALLLHQQAPGLVMGEAAAPLGLAAAEQALIDHLLLLAALAPGGHGAALALSGTFRAGAGPAAGDALGIGGQAADPDPAA